MTTPRPSGHQTPGASLVEAGEVFARHQRRLHDTFAAIVRPPALGVDVDAGLVAAPAPLERLLSLGKVISEGVRRALPPNWSGRPLASVVELERVAREDGIAVAWVPRPEVLDALLEADVGGRSAVLEQREAEIVEDCAACVSAIDHPGLADFLPLATEAVKAFQLGLVNASQAMSVALLDGLIRLGVERGLVAADAKREELRRGFYKTVRDSTAVEIDDVYLFEVRRLVVLAPVERFYSDWRPGDPNDFLKRHAVSHAPKAGPAGSYTRPFSLLALMMLASLLREWQEDWVR